MEEITKHAYNQKYIYGKSRFILFTQVKTHTGIRTNYFYILWKTLSIFIKSKQECDETISDKLTNIQLRNALL